MAALSGLKSLFTNASIVESISKTIRQVAFDKPILADEHDVECYVDRLKKTMLREIVKGKKIQV